MSEYLKVDEFVLIASPNDGETRGKETPGPRVISFYGFDPAICKIRVADNGWLHLEQEGFEEPLVFPSEHWRRVQLEE